MEGSTTNDADRTDRTHASQPLVGRARRILTLLGGPNRRGTIAMLVGGALVARSRSARGRLRTALSFVAGLALVAYGVRHRLSGARRNGGGGRGPAERPDDRTGATDDGVGATESIRHESHTGTNPRDVDQEPDVGQEPDVEPETDASEDDVRFTTDQSPGPRTEPAETTEAGEHDSRLDDDQEADADDPVEVDISEAAMADEPAEAAGPSESQAYPTQVEDTEPDESPEADASNVEADQPATDVGDEAETDVDDEAETDGSDDNGTREADEAGETDDA